MTLLHPIEFCCVVAHLFGKSLKPVEIIASRQKLFHLNRRDINFPRSVGLSFKNSSRDRRIRQLLECRQTRRREEQEDRGLDLQQPPTPVGRGTCGFPSTSPQAVPCSRASFYSPCRCRIGPPVEFFTPIPSKGMSDTAGLHDQATTLMIFSFL